ncbi:glutathione S-transferase [Vibrio cholerae]|uniref:glutathione S-transferase n=1 Tax=Vibrio cholerae TaxID=666 RepID=UPI001A9E9BBE|nr:glutathione S-transferase [Vibrio cholerae]MBO1365982.1 glutathione S-transferase [Vibrio cholerae]MBO1370946.1 glutathione S-transferase [Vibrio cholerae]MBO1374032.1 glutathione S-transferase [Vibrio cholerae]MBO1378530.1 glutathione S-transferase [Vibrio cholerae]MBO1406864.1 glutathione S-transferase [Vibrio cholerae]
MKLYETAMTPSCRRVSIFLKELGIDVERVQVDVRGGENLSDTFKSKSLNGKVPLLELDEGTTLCESVAICRYFDLAYPNMHKLFGDSALEQAQVEMWHRVVEFQGLYAGFQAFRNLSGIYKDREHCVYAWGEESKARVAAFLPQLEQRLAQSRFIATDRFTIVDITAYIFIGFAPKALEIPVFEHYPHITRWFERLSQRPAFQ